jgi:hypothetical protein
MKWFIVVIFFGLALIAGCISRKTHADFDFSQLIGIWSSISEEASQMEEWEVLNDSIFVGKGYVLERGDTTFFESLEIRKQFGVWTYFAKVYQNQGAEVVPFTLTRQTADRVEFTNTEHDFPKKIGYELLSDNELHAYIEGPRDGQTIRIIFDFKRKL